MWTTTKAQIQQRIESMVSRRTGDSALSFVEKLIISDAVNSALIEICTQTGISHLGPVIEDTTADTTANTNYVDLDSSVVSIVEGTVRIEAEDARLSSMSLSDFYAIDPGEDATGMPSLYCLSSSDTTPRLLLRDTPDASYTIALTVKKIVDENSISSFPGWMHPLLRTLSIANAFSDLNLNPTIHMIKYKKLLADVKDTIGGDLGPRHIQISYYRRHYDNIENRRMT